MGSKPVAVICSGAVPELGCYTAAPRVELVRTWQHGALDAQDADDFLPDGRVSNIELSTGATLVEFHGELRGNLTRGLNLMLKAVCKSGEEEGGRGCGLQ
jgi:hypothetical protein